MSSITISEFVTKVVSEILANYYDDSETRELFHAAGMSRLPENRNRVALCRDYLQLANAAGGADPLFILGRLLSRYMDDDQSFKTNFTIDDRETDRERIACALE